MRHAAGAAAQIATDEVQARIETPCGVYGKSQFKIINQNTDMDMDTEDLIDMRERELSRALDNNASDSVIADIEMELDSLYAKLRKEVADA